VHLELARAYGLTMQEYVDDVVLALSRDISRCR